MKAVIVDLRGNQSAALCDDGRVVKLADAGYSLGQIVDVHERKRRTPLWVRYASTAAAAALLLVGAGGGAAYAMPYGVVSLDVNPSLEYTINRFDYVLKVEGVNEDGKALLAGMDTSKLTHHRIGDALEASVQQLEEQDLLGGESGEILISAGTKQPDHAEKLVSALEDDLGSKRQDLEIRAFAVSEEDIDNAHREGMSAGRHRMLGELKESEGDGFSADDWKDRSIHDILSRLENGPEIVSGRGEERPAPAETRGDEDARPAMAPDTQRPARAAEQVPDTQQEAEFHGEQPKPDSGESSPAPAGDFSPGEDGPGSMSAPAPGGATNPGMQGGGGPDMGGPGGFGGGPGPRG